MNQIGSLSQLRQVLTSWDKFEQIGHFQSNVVQIVSEDRAKSFKKTEIIDLGLQEVEQETKATTRACRTFAAAKNCKEMLKYAMKRIGHHCGL